MEKVAFSLATGEVSNAFPTPAGYCLLRVEEKKPSAIRVYEEVQAGIKARLALVELAGESDPLSQVRLARLHGRRMPDRYTLQQTARWQECRSAVDHCRDAPSLHVTRCLRSR